MWGYVACHRLRVGLAVLALLVVAAAGLPAASAFPTRSLPGVRGQVGGAVATKSKSLMLHGVCCFRVAIDIDGSAELNQTYYDGSKTHKWHHWLTTEWHVRAIDSDYGGLLTPQLVYTSGKVVDLPFVEDGSLVEVCNPCDRLIPHDPSKQCSEVEVEAYPNPMAAHLFKWVRGPRRDINLAQLGLTFEGSSFLPGPDLYAHCIDPYFTDPHGLLGIAPLFPRLPTPKVTHFLALTARQPQLTIVCREGDGRNINNPPNSATLIERLYVRVHITRFPQIGLGLAKTALKGFVGKDMTLPNVAENSEPSNGPLPWPTGCGHS